MRKNSALRHSIGGVVFKGGFFLGGINDGNQVVVGVVFVGQLTDLAGAFAFELTDHSAFQVVFVLGDPALGVADVGYIAQVVVAKIRDTAFGISPTGDAAKAVVFEVFRMAHGVIGSRAVACCVVGLAADVATLTGHFYGFHKLFIILV